MSTRPVPILTYHFVAQRPSHLASPHDVYVSPGMFRAQIHVLAARGYRAITLRDAYSHWMGRVELPALPVVITFDDGHESVYTEALPVLAALGWVGVVNVTIDRLRHRGWLRPAMIRELVAAGWEIGAHTVAHPDLTKVSRGRLALEVITPRIIIRRVFGAASDFFCYPYGRYNEAVTSQVRSAGYLGATTTTFGLAIGSECFSLRRIHVGAKDDAPRVAERIEALRKSTG